MKYQSLITDCERHLAQNGEASSAEALVYRLEAMLGVVEEGVQLLSTSDSTFNTELSLVKQMRSNLKRYLRLVIYLKDTINCGY